MFIFTLSNLQFVERVLLSSQNVYVELSTEITVFGPQAQNSLFLYMYVVVLMFLCGPLSKKLHDL